MDFLFIILIIILLLLIYMSFEASFVEVKRVKMTKSLSYLKVIHLSDIHIGMLRVSSTKVKQVIDDEKPDIILLTGDYIEKKSQMPQFLDFIKSAGIGSNAYLCFGNHDYETFIRDNSGFEAFKKVIKSFGINILLNESMYIEKNLKVYNIIGFDELRYKRHNIQKAMSNIKKDAFMNIGITHNPDMVLEMPKNIIDYLFCGHFHGGQIWAPFGLEYKVLRKDKLCKMGIRHGMHKLNGINIYISRGLGNVLFPLRLFSRPEITIIHLP